MRLFVLLLLMIICIKMGATESIATEKKEKRLREKAISLNFQHIDKRAVLQILADFTGINMVVSEQVKGTMTLRLNNLPWEEALNVILETQGLVKHQVGKVLLIDTKENLRKNNVGQLKNKQILRTLEPVCSKLFQINYAKAVELASFIQDKHNSLLSKQGKISADPRTNTLWLQDIKTNIKEVQRVIKQLDRPVQQVLIEARIVEVNKDLGQEIGIRWETSKNAPLVLDDTKKTSSHLDLTERLNLDLGALSTSPISPTLGLALAKLGSGILLDLELSALESEGRAELISSPRVITTNQQAAIIESGEEIPYQEATSGGATAVSFKKAVLSLKVTPQITPNGKILIHLQINQDNPTVEKFNGVPAIYTKQIKTNVLVNNGETIVLGGIYKQDKNNSISRLPLLGRLPMIGMLFHNKRISLKNEELLIFITPRIISDDPVTQDRNLGSVDNGSISRTTPTSLGLGSKSMDPCYQAEGSRLGMNCQQPLKYF